jgi:hypothetical protein
MSYFPPGQHVINVNLCTRVIAYSVTMGGEDGLRISEFEALQEDLDKVMTLHLGERELLGVIWNGEKWLKASQAQLKKALDEGEDYDGPQVAIERTTLCSPTGTCSYPKYTESYGRRGSPY